MCIFIIKLKLKLRQRMSVLMIRNKQSKYNVYAVIFPVLLIWSGNIHLFGMPNGTVFYKWKFRDVEGFGIKKHKI